MTALALGILLFACNSGQKDRNKGQEQITSQEKSEELSILEDILFLYPSPGEIIENFQDVNLEYTPGLANPAENQDNYLDSRSQALNLGIYFGDLAYCAKYGKTNEAIDYLEAIRNLGEKTGISSAYFETLVDRAKQSMSNRDSIVMISNEAFYRMIKFMEQSRKESTLAIISSGAYIESLYLILESEETFDSNNPVFQYLADMKYPFDNMVERARMYKDEQNMESICRYLREIGDTFDALEAKTSETTVEKKDGQLIIGGGITYTINEQNFKDIKSTVGRIRKEITSI